MGTKRFPVRGYAESTLLCAAELYEDPLPDDPIGDNDDDIRAVVAAWRAGKTKAIVVEARSLLPILRGLTALANGEDETAEMEAARPLDQRHPDDIRAARAASWGLTNLSGRIVAWAKTEGLNA